MIEQHDEPRTEDEGVQDVEGRHFVPDPTAMTGTLDTTDTGGASLRDVRAVTDAFRVSDERAATVVRESEDPANHGKTAQEVEAEAHAAREASRRQAYQERVDAGLARRPAAAEGTYDPGVADVHGHPRGEVNDPQPSTEEEPEDDEYEAEEDAEYPEGFGEFDPAEHNVEGDGGVLAYLNSLPYTERGVAEHERVVEAERNGKARRGVLGD